MLMAKRARERVFLALFLPPRLRPAVATLQRQFGAGESFRSVDPQKLHFTLVFLGELSRSERLCVMAITRGIAQRQRRFTLTLRKRSGTFHQPDGRSDILFVGVQKSRPLQSLQRNLELAFQESALIRSSRRFVPHLMIGRVSHQQPQFSASLPRLAWIVHEIAIVTSTPVGTHHRYTIWKRISLKP
ncbi:MAG: RNA 2',3'-cyclic phosphodiesterase [Candidatus Kerfeldbacteria bacterium]|nr:RNA 2',3'-cyclic phosphodiesterase [Candidatus Kerfeldbacteria bacterium]